MEGKPYRPDPVYQPVYRTHRLLVRPLRETKLATTKLAAAFVEYIVETFPYGKQNLLLQYLQQLCGNFC